MWLNVLLVLLLSVLIGLWHSHEIVEQEKIRMSQRKSSSSSSKNAKELTVVVPCYEEALNVRPLCTRLFAATKKAGLTVELILVDDYSGQGSEDTKKVVSELKKEGFNIDVVVRMPEQGKGLSSAVLHGFKMARYGTILCMDADLQHEPESVPDVAKPVLTGEAEFAVGSRHVEGGSAEDFPLIRRLISFVATALAYPLTSSTDPMSGFFAIDKDVFQRGLPTVNPVGFKIGLELMVRCQCKTVVDVPIRFRDREAGESKLTMKQNFYYLMHLVHLYWFKYPGLIILALIVSFCITYLFLHHFVL